MMDPAPAFVADRSRPGVLVLTVDGFEAGLGRWMGEQLAGLSPETDVIIDLRGNSGGRLAEADAVLSCFLPRDRLWAARTGRSGRPQEMRTAGGCGDLDQPVANDVAVLVDANSRSAAELTPAALQEARRAVVVGTATAGAVLISQETRLPDGGRLSLSRADFTTSGGVRLEKRGVTPDVFAPQTSADRAAGRDPRAGRRSRRPCGYADPIGTGHSGGADAVGPEGPGPAPTVRGSCRRDRRSMSSTRRRGSDHALRNPVFGILPRPAGGSPERSGSARNYPR